MACWTENGGSPLPLGCCIAGVQLQNCVSERNLEQHANALSRQKETMELTHVSTAATGMQAKVAILEIQLAQLNDEVTLRLFEALETSDGVQMDTCEDGMLNCMWSQFVIVDGVLCRKYAPGPTTETVTVPILPKSLQQKALLQCHDSPGAGHRGFKKTLE